MFMIEFLHTYILEQSHTYCEVVHELGVQRAGTVPFPPNVGPLTQAGGQASTSDS